MNDTVRKTVVRLLRTKEVLAITGLSRVTIYRLEQAGLFPKRLQLGRGAVAWAESDIETWIRTRPSGPKRMPTMPQLPLFGPRPVK